MAETQPTSSSKVHTDITERMIAALEAGTVPWRKPWGAAAGAPRSMATGERYKGVNVLLLGMTALERSYDSPYWATIPQLNKLGATVLKGQSQANGKGPTTIVYYENKSKEEANPDTGQLEVVSFPVARAFRVFNAAQCNGLPAKYYPQPGTDETLAEPQAIHDGYLANGGPEVKHVAGDRAHYLPGEDRIELPLRTQFKSPAHYHGTRFHEEVHSTGAAKRLDRPGIANFDHFGSGQYAREELVAQIGSAILQAETGLETDDLFTNSVAYVNSWLGALKNDHRLVTSAASHAQKAVDHITTAADIEVM